MAQGGAPEVFGFPGVPQALDPGYVGSFHKSTEQGTRTLRESLALRVQESGFISGKLPGGDLT